MQKGVHNTKMSPAKRPDSIQQQRSLSFVLWAVSHHASFPPYSPTYPPYLQQSTIKIETDANVSNNDCVCLLLAKRVCLRLELMASKSILFHVAHPTTHHVHDGEADGQFQHLHGHEHAC